MFKPMMVRSGSQVSQTPRWARGFTLIELLIVVAIIAILAAILFPVFARARENARRSSCQSNMRQLGLAMTQYAADYDETTPLSYQWDYGIIPYIAVPGGVTQYSNLYGKALLCFRCPSDTVKRSGGAGRSYSIAGAGEGLGPYGTVPGDNKGFAGPIFLNPAQVNCTAGCPSRGRRLSEVEDTAGTFMIVENHDGNNIVGSGNDSVMLRPVTRGSCGTLADSRTGGCGQDMAAYQKATDRTPVHLEAWNYLFVDGHVKALRPEKTVNASVNVWAQTWPYNMGGMWTIAGND